MPFKKATALLFCIAASASALPSSQRRDLPGGTQTGQATFFSPGLGACGTTSSDSDLIAAVSTSIFGTTSLNNPACGKQITGGKSVTVTVQDACPSCGAADLDLSPAAFNSLADPAAGRIPITWSVV